MSFEKDSVMPLTANGKVTLSQQAQCDGQRVRLDPLILEANTGVKIGNASFAFLLLDSDRPRFYTGGYGNHGGSLHAFDVPPTSGQTQETDARVSSESLA